MLLSGNSPLMVKNLVVWFLVEIVMINYHKWLLDEKIKWADSCVYLVVELKAGRTFTTLAEKNRRKFCACVYDVIGNSDFLSEECVAYLKLFRNRVFANINVWCRGLEVASRG